ncbi:MAG: phytanoyl-CoA dioxygenase family protein [Gammaproteobacteria bacterium]|nr:phytanoyl-CoA dioxygenase family protein [Gammaproteobacteria bacterium]
MSLKTENTKRVESLAAPPPLTHGLELNEADAARVEAAVATVDRVGYALVTDFLGPEQLESVRAAMAPIFELTGTRDLRKRKGHARSGYRGLQTVHVHNLFAKTRAVDAVALDPVLLKIIEGVLGPLFQMSVATAMCPDPGVDPQGLHQDDGHYPLARPRPPFIANTLIALDDFTRANGATRIVPGSHRWTKPVEQETAVSYAEMPAGSLLVFDGALWHAGGGNTTKDQRRRSINLNFNLSWLRQQENQYVGIPRDVWLAMPERLQRLLGFQKVNFLYGSVDYMDPLEYFKAHAD